MITKTSKVTFNKSGNGSRSGRITVPSDFLKLLNVSEEDREVTLVYDREKNSITIMKENN